MAEATLRLARQPSKWRDRGRAYTVLLDGTSVGEVANGATEVFTVSPGDHTLRIRIDWSGSREEPFHAGPGETIEFTCRAADAKLAILSVVESIFGRDRWVVLERA